MIHRDIMSPQKTILVLFLVVLVGVFLYWIFFQRVLHRDLLAWE